MYFLTSNKFKEFPPHFKIHPNRIPRPNRRHSNKIFRKVTPERSVASMGLLFVKKILLE
ncbi:hypothetical protein [Avibacterium volantium]|uniref:hypothetical protein n=1 Tax=Avibacterium volantium TaxID=762 RepID=UPI0013DFFE88|nr:hypothetical protein [Avibacterium volantium]